MPRRNPPPPSVDEAQAVMKAAHALVREEAAEHGNAESKVGKYRVRFRKALARLWDVRNSKWLMDHCGATTDDLDVMHKAAGGHLSRLTKAYEKARRGRAAGRGERQAGLTAQFPSPTSSVVACGFEVPARGVADVESRRRVEEHLAWDYVKMKARSNWARMADEYQEQGKTLFIGDAIAAFRCIDLALKEMGDKRPDAALLRLHGNLTADAVADHFHYALNYAFDRGAWPDSRAMPYYKAREAGKHKQTIDTMLALYYRYLQKGPSGVAPDAQFIIENIPLDIDDPYGVSASEENLKRLSNALSGVSLTAKMVAKMTNITDPSYQTSEDRHTILGRYVKTNWDHESAQRIASSYAPDLLEAGVPVSTIIMAMADHSLDTFRGNRLRETQAKKAREEAYQANKAKAEKAEAERQKVSNAKFYKDALDAYLRENSKGGWNLWSPLRAVPYPIVSASGGVSKALGEKGWDLFKRAVIVQPGGRIVLPTINGGVIVLPEGLVKPTLVEAVTKIVASELASRADTRFDVGSGQGFTNLRATPEVLDWIGRLDRRSLVMEALEEAKGIKASAKAKGKEADDLPSDAAIKAMFEHDKLYEGGHDGFTPKLEYALEPYDSFMEGGGGWSKEPLWVRSQASVGLIGLWGIPLAQSGLNLNKDGVSTESGLLLPARQFGGLTKAGELSVRGFKRLAALANEMYNAFGPFPRGMGMSWGVGFRSKDGEILADWIGSRRG